MGAHQRRSPGNGERRGATTARVPRLLATSPRGECRRRFAPELPLDATPGGHPSACPDLDFPRSERLRLGQAQPQDALLKLGFDLRGVNPLGYAEDAPKLPRPKLARERRPAQPLVGSRLDRELPLLKAHE